MTTSEPHRPPAPVIGRRTFLAGVVATALAAGCSNGDGDDPEPTGGSGDGAVPETAADLPPVPTDLPADVFALGVASGDPLPDSVILWTRLVNDPLADGGGLPEQPLPVRWEVAADERFDDVVASGDAVAEPALAHAVHVDASGLEADTWYWYRFSVGESTSAVGRTRTAPEAGGQVERLRFAFASCQNFQHGYWPAHAQIAADDIDLVLFLGDYIYESAPDPDAVRTHQAGAPVDLAGYRRRYGEYKADAALQAAHARAPWVCTWDDHEVENNYADDVPDGDAVSREAFAERRAAAYQAYYEHMPLRVEQPDGADLTLYRAVDWGDLARFYVLDGRQYRSDQACDVPLDVGVSCAEVADDDRTMLGDEQEAWLADELDGSDATWNVVAQQTIVSKITLPLGSNEGLNLDQWDGYPAARARLVERLREVDNPVVITGDIHASGVGVITDDPADASTPAAVPELVGTSISSRFPPDLVALVERAAAASPTIRYAEPHKRGYVLCEVTSDALEASFRYASTVATADAEVTTGARWVIRAGDPEPRAL
ncbi:MAG: alkaline phosphatase D family protein [Acidimicrobiales bacterium]|nr:alkaline phosphatase D family protein [Acidimicrobiales bacterium]